MMLLLTSQPLWTAVIFLGLVTLLAMGAPILIRRRVELARLRTNNEVAGLSLLRSASSMPCCSHLR